MVFFYIGDYVSNPEALMLYWAMYVNDLQQILQQIYYSLHQGWHMANQNNVSTANFDWWNAVIEIEISTCFQGN